MSTSVILFSQTLKQGDLWEPCPGGTIFRQGSTKTLDERRSWSSSFSQGFPSWRPMLWMWRPWPLCLWLLQVSPGWAKVITQVCNLLLLTLLGFSLTFQSCRAQPTLWSLVMLCAVPLWLLSYQAVTEVITCTSFCSILVNVHLWPWLMVGSNWLAEAADSQSGNQTYVWSIPEGWVVKQSSQGHVCTCSLGKKKKSEMLVFSTTQAQDCWKFDSIAHWGCKLSVTVYD